MKQACRDKSVVFFFFQYILCSTLMYWALYYSKIKRQITMYKIYILYREWLAKCKNLFVNIIFQWLLKKLISKSPHGPPHVHTCVLWAKVPFHSFSFFCFLQVRMQGFYMKALLILLFISRTDRESNCCVTKTAHAWMEGTECQRMWLRTKTQKFVTVNSMFNVFEVAIFFYRTDINIRAIY